MRLSFLQPVLSGLVMLLLTAACQAILPVAPSSSPIATPASPDGPGAPTVHLELDRKGMVRSGAQVSVRVTGNEHVTALRLAIDGADTGWRPVSPATPDLHYSWIAGEPGLYEIVGHAQAADGAVAEQRHTLTVLPYAQAAMRGEARIVETRVTLPTYPLEDYLADAVNPVYRWPYRTFDHERYAQAPPQPEPRDYRLIILENDYLQVSLLPDVGGRIWQIVHKPSGDTMFYQNAVVKPSPWGPLEQRGWLALGGLEWALPVNEHGYDWGTTWDFTTFQDEDGSVGAVIATPDDGRLLQAAITVTLAADVAALTVRPAIHNRSAAALDFHYWQTAMLAPGPGNSVGPDLRFVLPNRLMMVHSTGDPMLPAPEAHLTWPRTFGRDLSRLGNWFRYIGLFEYPAARGPFVGVYDPASDAGAVRVFPAEIARGSKLFGLGWREPIPSDAYTDDGSAYVELHGGLSPTFFEPARLDRGETVTWEETWYPIRGSGGLVTANRAAALAVTPEQDGWRLGLYPTTAIEGTLQVMEAGIVVASFAVDTAPDAPFTALLPRASLDARLPARPFVVRLVSAEGQTLLSYTASTD